MRQKLNRLLLAALGSGVLLIAACGSIDDPRTLVRLPTAAGSFYPQQQDELNDILKKAFYNAPPPVLDGPLKALILPHAGYVYSGIINAIGMRALANQDIDTIYIIGTSHFADVGGALAWQGKAFRTPLGDYPVDSKTVRDLLALCPDIRLYGQAWEKEHSVEVQVPFLQKVAPHAKLVPLLMGTSTWDECWSVAQAIVKVSAKQKAIVIASSDMSHYPSWADAGVIDHKTLEAVTALDPIALDRIDQEFLAKGISDLACTYCGLSAVKTVMIAANLMGANSGQLLYYANSGDITPDRDRVVGYSAVAFVANAAKPAIHLEKPVQETVSLGQDQKNELLDIARASIAEGLATRTQVNPTTAQTELLKKAAVFVTLKRNDQLQGCVGMTEPRLPLYKAAAQMACAAAFEDPRFQPLRAEELPYTDIEISVLSALTRIKDPKEISLGIHGVMVKRDNLSGIFLPQVATETGWNKDEFLNNLCSQKAHLPADSWRDKKTELYIFTVQSFHQSGPAVKKAEP
jgi:AmmeMemoRadiSam system protein B/AmmeMemoRadiSam system protein A